MVPLVNSRTKATRIGWHLWEIDLRIALNSTPGWLTTHQLSLTTRAGGVEQVVYELRALQESVTRLATAVRGKP